MIGQDMHCQKYLKDLNFLQYALNNRKENSWGDCKLFVCEFSNQLSDD